MAKKDRHSNSKKRIMEQIKTTDKKKKKTNITMQGQNRLTISYINKLSN